MKQRMSIKWKMLLYLFGFTSILLCILWLFQTVYLEEFYKGIKTSELEKALDNIEDIVTQDTIEESIATVAEKCNICVIVADKDGNRIYSSENDIHCAIHKLPNSEIKRLIKQTGKNGNVVKIRNNDGLTFEKPFINNVSENKNTDKQKNMEKNTGYKEMINRPRGLDDESLILVKKLTIEGIDDYYIFLNSIITPVSATVDTLRIQLVYISVIMVTIAIVMGIIISIRVSKPIIKINETAKDMSKGNYDVTYEEGVYKEINELSKTLNIATKELKKTEGFQKEIIANVSHDLRTPLTMITAYAEVMRDIPGENSPENVQVIIDEAKRLTNLVNDMLDISKLQAGVNVLETSEYNLTAGIREVINRYAKLISQDGYKITFENVDEDVTVYADEFKIYQVLYNLINNAINYSGNDKCVTIKQIVYGNIVRIEVTDNGEGIDPKELDNVWERYYKIDKKHKRAVMGTGLGLSICKNILKLHNAKYGVRSIVGKGSTFWFELKVINK